MTGQRYFSEEIYKSMRVTLTAASMILFVFAAAASVEAQLKPDLVVRKVTVTKSERNGESFFDKITVGVANICNGSQAGPSFLRLTIKKNATDPKTLSLLVVGSMMNPIKGGETAFQTFSAK